MNTIRTPWLLVSLFSVLFVTSCGPKYACAGLEGGGCTTVADAYLATSSPDWTDARAAQRDDGRAADTQDPTPTDSASAAASIVSPSAGQPILSQPRVLRLWIKHWEDVDRDLHAGSYIFLRVTDAEWRVQ